MYDLALVPRGVWSRLLVWTVDSRREGNVDLVVCLYAFAHLTCSCMLFSTHHHHVFARRSPRAGARATC